MNSQSSVSQTVGPNQVLLVVRLGWLTVETFIVPIASKPAVI